jgi:hypothetical protein
MSDHIQGWRWCYTAPYTLLWLTPGARLGQGLPEEKDPT